MKNVNDPSAADSAANASTGKVYLIRLEISRMARGRRTNHSEIGQTLELA